MHSKETRPAAVAQPLGMISFNVSPQKLAGSMSGGGNSEAAF